MLTNFVTIRKRLGLLDQLEARQANGEFDRLTKKEASRLTDEMTRLQRTLGGMRKMRRLPGALFVVDPQREHIAVTEARKLEIPVIGTGDTNVDPDQLDYIIPANDDAIRAIRLLCRLVADAAIEGPASAPLGPPRSRPWAPRSAEAEEASDEVIAAIAAGGTYSFAPEPDEDEALLPGEDLADELLAVDDSSAEAIGVVLDEEPEAGSAKTTRPKARKAGVRTVAASDEDEAPADAGDAVATERRSMRPAWPMLPRRRRMRSRRRPAPRPPSDEDGQGRMTTSMVQTEITPALVKELRERTGAGFMDCKRALEESSGDLDEGRRAAPRAGPGGRRQEGRPRSPRRPGGLVHPRRRPAGRAHRGQLRDRLRGPQRRLPEARSRPRDAGRRLRARVPDHRVHPGRGRSSARRPSCSADEAMQTKPEASARRSSRASSRKWYKEVVLYEQPFRDSEQTVGQLVTDAIARIGENIRVRRFARYQLGEEL